MDYAACNIVYVDRNAQENRLVARPEDVASVLATKDTDSSSPALNHQNPPRKSLIEDNLKTLLRQFREVHVCTSGKSCLDQLAEFNQASMVDLVPTLVLVDVPHDDYMPERRLSTAQTFAPSSRESFSKFIRNSTTCDDPTEDAYGTGLIQWISSKIQYKDFSRLIVPVAIVVLPDTDSFLSLQQLNYLRPTPKSLQQQTCLLDSLDQTRTTQLLDTGAVDVLISPIREERLSSLMIHAYRAHKEALREHRVSLGKNKDRKRSWVGLDDEKPYAYLREVMVSGLMDKICQLGDHEEPIRWPRMVISLDRKKIIATVLDSWHFSAHDFTDDELLYAALLMLQHTLKIPELEPWRMSTEKLTGFLFASRLAYNSFVPYHNFRHVVDVLQACFVFLVRLGRIPPYPDSSAFSNPQPSALADSIRPFDALTLLITAIGHDVGHPGVNNAFLVALNAPLAQLYNDRSVLESFHCAAYSQILRRYWPAAFQAVEMRKLMINTILATDMGLHFDYMNQLGSLHEKLHDQDHNEEWNPQILGEWRILACSLLIKCADISNVARTHTVASQWTIILTDEFARQAAIEEDLGITSTLFAAPVREVTGLGKSQIDFMNMFAVPLFKGVADVMPEMAFCAEELLRNRSAWQERISEEWQAEQCCQSSVLTNSLCSLALESSLESSETCLLKLNNQNTLVQDDRHKIHPLEAFSNEQMPKGSRCLPEVSINGTSMNRHSVNSSPKDSIFRNSSDTQQNLRAMNLGLSYLGKSNKNTSLSQLGTKGFAMNSSVTEVVLAQNFTHEFQEAEKKSSVDTSLIAGDWTGLTRSRKMSLSPCTLSPSMAPNSESESNSTSLHKLLMPTSTQTNDECVISRTRDESTEGSEDEKVVKNILAIQRLRVLHKKSSRFRLNFWKSNKSGSHSSLPVGGCGEDGDVDKS